MKSIDIKSVIIGILGTILVFVSIGATDKNLGDITVNSIKVMDDGTGGFIQTHNADGKMTAYLGTGEDGIGFLRTYNADGKQTSYLGTGEEGFGFLRTFNTDGKETSYLGTGEDGSGILTIQNMEGELIAGFGSSPDNGKDGAAILFDRYGDVGWTASGKK